MNRLLRVSLALNPGEANHALKCSKHCQCATCLGVKLAFAASEDTTLRIEIRDSRPVSRFSWRDFMEGGRYAA